MRVLVATASKHGSTREIGRVVAAALEDVGIAATAMSTEDVSSLSGFDAVVLGSAVYMGRWLPEAREFVAEHTSGLLARPVWLFSSGPLGDPPKPNAQLEDPEEMAVATEAREHRMFAGRLERSELTMKERTIVKMVRAPYGDFRDWAAIRSWARGIGNELNPSTSVERRRAS